jgi:hypothetical protein
MIRDGAGATPRERKNAFSTSGAAGLLGQLIQIDAALPLRNPVAAGWRLAGRRPTTWMASPLAMYIRMY